MSVKLSWWLACLVFCSNLFVGLTAQADERSKQVSSLQTVGFHQMSGSAQAGDAHWTSPVVPLGEFDVIGLHRYGDAADVGPVLLYLPGTNMNSKPLDLEEEADLLRYLSNRGATVYGMDYRTSAVPAEFAGDMTFMRSWTMDRFVQDAAFAFQFVESMHPDQPIGLAGFSRGASYAYALAGQVNASGLIALDGSFKPAIPKAFDAEAALAQLEQNGQYANILSERRGWPGRQAMFHQVINNPNAPVPTPESEHASTAGRFTAGKALAQTLYRAWGPGALANPILANPRGGVSDIETLARLMVNYDRFFPAVQNIERKRLAGQLDDPESCLDDNFGALGIPVLVIAGTGLGGDHLINSIYSATQSGASATEIHVLEGYGHLDVLVARDAHREVFDVILSWLGTLKSDLRRDLPACIIGTK